MKKIVILWREKKSETYEANFSLYFCDCILIESDKGWSHPHTLFCINLVCYLFSQMWDYPLCFGRRVQRSARVLKESRYQHLLPSFDWSRSRPPLNFPVLMSLGLSISEISQFDKSQSWHPRNCLVLMSLGLNIQKISQSQWVSVSTSNIYPSLDESQSRNTYQSLVE